MKRGTPDHPKTLALSLQLGLRRWGAVGLLEMLWHFTAKYAPQGDVGKFTDLAIARAVDWNRDAGRLVQAMTVSGWLDPCDCHRLVVHDWADHADQTILRMLTRQKLVIVQHKTSQKLAVTSLELAADSHKLVMASQKLAETSQKLAITSSCGAKPEPEPEPEP